MVCPRVKAWASEFRQQAFVNLNGLAFQTSHEKHFYCAFERAPQWIEILPRSQAVNLHQYGTYVDENAGAVRGGNRQRAASGRPMSRHSASFRRKIPFV